MPSLGILPSIVITLFVLLGAIIGSLFGLLRGFKRSIVTIIGTTTAALLALILAKPISNWLTKTILTSLDLKSLVSGFGDLMAISPSLEEFINVLPAVIIAPIVYIVLFVILKLIVKIPCGIISLSMGSKSDRRVLGMPIGAAQGIISSLVIVFVITGFISTADNVIGAIKKDTSSATAELRQSFDEVDEIFDSVKKDPVVGILCRKAPQKSNLTTSVNFVFSNLTSFKFRDESVKLNEELVSVVDTVMCITPIASNTNISSWSDKEIDALQNFADKLTESVLLKNIGTDIVAGACTKWYNNEEFMGMAAPKADELINPLMNALFGAFKDTTVNTIHDDFTTVIDLLRTFSKHNVFASLNGGNSEGMLNALSGDLVKDILSVLNSNPHGHFDALVGEVANLGLRILAQTLNLPENNNEIYANLTNEIASTLNDIISDGITEEEIGQLTDDTKAILASNGIAVSDEAVEVISNAVLEKFENSDGNISGDNIQEFFQEFATAFDATEDFFGESGNTGASNGLLNLSGTSNGSTETTYADINLSEMSYSDKLSVLAQLGVYDYFNSLYNLSYKSPYDVLSNGEVADSYVEYLIHLTLAVGNSRDNIVNKNSPNTKPAIATLSSADSMVTTKVTAEALMVDTSVQLSKTDIEQIGVGFEAITKFINSYSAVGGELGLDQLAQLDIAAAGQALDILKTVPTFSNTVDMLSAAVIGEIVGSNVDIIDKINSGNVTYEELFTTVQSTAKVIGNISNENASEDEKQQAILDLLFNLTPETADIVNEIITVDFVIKQGFGNKDNATVSVKALRRAFVEMASLTGEEHETEAKYISKVFELAMYTKNNGANNNMFGETGLFKSEEDFVLTTITSNVASAALAEISKDENGAPIYDAMKMADKLSETNKANVVSTMRDMYNEEKQSASAEELNILKDRMLVVSYLLNLELDFID